MNEPEEGPSRIALRSEGAPGPREEREETLRATPSVEVREQHCQMATYLRRIARAIERLSSEHHELHLVAIEATTALDRFAQREQSYASELQKNQRLSHVTPDPSGRPETEDPFTLALLDYVDNLRNDGVAFISAARALVTGNLPEVHDVEAEWQVYERLSELYRNTQQLVYHMEGLRDLAGEWQVGNTEALAWVTKSTSFLKICNESVRVALAGVRGSLS